MQYKEVESLFCLYSTYFYHAMLYDTACYISRYQIKDESGRLVTWVGWGGREGSGAAD